MIFIPALEQLDVTQEVWDHVTEMAKQRQIDDEVLLDVQHRASQLNEQRLSQSTYCCGQCPLLPC